MSGFDNEILYAENVDFSGDSQVEAKVTSNGQLLIGADSTPNIRVGTLTSGYLTEVTNGEGSITIDASEEIVTSNVFITDNSILRGDGGMRVVQPSAAEITDAGVCNGITQLNVDNTRLDGNALLTTNTDGNLNLTPNGGGIISQTKSVIGSDVKYLAFNTDNTNASSDCYYQATTGGTSSGDAYFTASVSTTTAFGWGIDNSDSDKLKETYTNSSSNSTPSGGTLLRSMTTSGEQTLPLQPAYFAYLGSTDSNVTGDGTQFIMGDTDVGTALTEVFDQNGDFTTGSSGGAVFTAPVTGRYYLGFNFLLQGLTNGTNTLNSRISTSNGDYTLNNDNDCFSGNNQYLLSTLADMDALDESRAVVIAGNGTKVVNVFGGGRRTAMYGWLVC
jgi:hypothetical protein